MCLSQVSGHSRYAEATQKMATSTFHGNRHLALSFVAAFFLCYWSALKEVNDDRNHRK
jgi:hypothetical protein